MLKLSNGTFDAIRAHGERTFPHECCGVLLGSVSGNDRSAVSVYPIENRFDEKERYHRFLITPDDYREAEKAAKVKNLDILGFYHSHPDSPSVASQYDLDHAFPWFSYLIMSIMKSRYHDMHSWIMEDDRSKFVEEEVIIE
ncbi:MAG TPA: M67 family metallopeptidase [Bacteroidota bacterium]|nr:M67 family metallopeptidase [Bacteroidota bacterium]